MASSELRIRASASRDVRGIPVADARRILARIESPHDDHRPAGSKKLASRDQYRIRQGDYRILHTVLDALLIVEIVKVGHRSDVYRES